MRGAPTSSSPMRAPCAPTRSRAACRPIALSSSRTASIPTPCDPMPTPGVRCGRAWGLSDDDFVVGCVARLDPMKDHANLLNAAASFARAKFRCALRLRGGWARRYRNQLQTLANSLGLADRVVWAGDIADVRAAYNAFDIATLASSFGEGFPNVVGEAMACGIPVAATDVGDVRLIAGELGEVVPPKNPDLLCAAWRRLRQRLAQRSEACARRPAARSSRTTVSTPWCVGPRTSSPSSRPGGRRRRSPANSRERHQRRHVARCGTGTSLKRWHELPSTRAKRLRLARPRRSPNSTSPV